ncbi:MAG: hypothetical protein ACRDTH_09080 [Pseudonocardiaceae bacterium]
MIVRNAAPGGDQGAAGNGWSAGSQGSLYPTGWTYGSSLRPIAECFERLGWQIVLTQWHQQRDGRYADTPIPGSTGRVPFLTAEQACPDGYVLHCPGGPECVGNFAKPALRPPTDVTGFDVDNYEGKTGGDTIAALEKLLGPLPPTYSLTARGPYHPSGRRWYRHPCDLVIPDRIFTPHGGYVETIRTGHRFSWAQPAVHVRQGQIIGPVLWYDPGHCPAPMPHVDALPELPSGWVDYIRAHGSAEANNAEPGEVTPKTRDAVDGGIAKIIQRLHSMPPAGGKFRSDVFGLAAELTRREIARGNTTDNVMARMRQIFADHPQRLTLNSDDEQWISEGMEKGVVTPYRFVANDNGGPVEMGPTARRSRAGRPELHIGSVPIATEWLRENIGSGCLAGMFNRDDTLVYTPQEGEEGYIPLTEDGSDGPAQIRLVTGDLLAAIIQYTYFCFRNSERTEEDSDGMATTTTVRTATMFPRQAAKTAVEVPHMCPNLRMLRGVIHSPLVRRDGSILDLPGYDDATRLLHIPAPGLIVPEVTDNPTRAEITAAVALLEEMVAGFQFLTDDYKANYFGLLLTPLLRDMVPPPYKMGAIGAPQPGSGKSLLASIMRIVHGGVFRSEMPRDEAEMHKQISSILDTTTAPVCQFDNVTGVLRSSTLAGLLTSDRWEARRLGSHTQISRPNDRLWVITGNNLCIGGDLVRRTVSVTIDPGVPDPHLRTGFAIPNLEGWAHQRRGDLIAALLTLIRAWVAAGRPTRARGSDGFARWIEAIEGILTTAGMAGSFDSAQTTSRTVGSEDEEWAEFLAAVYAVFGTQAWTAKQLLEQVDTIGAPPQLFGQTPAQPARPSIPLDALPCPLAEQVSRSHTGPTTVSKSLGRWLANHDGRWAGRLTVRRVGKDRTNLTRWRIETPNKV